MMAYERFLFTKVGRVRANLGTITGFTEASLAFDAVDAAVSWANRAGFKYLSSPFYDPGKETFFIGLEVYRTEAFRGHFRKDYSICPSYLYNSQRIRGASE
jgi:hypothetical protein